MAKEAEVDELRRRISQRLEENELQRKKEAQLHQEEMDNSTAKNQGYAGELKVLLTTFAEPVNND